jgi:hypothetical protein
MLFHSFNAQPSDPIPPNGLKTVSPSFEYKCKILSMVSNCKGQMCHHFHHVLNDIVMFLSNQYRTKQAKRILPQIDWQII